MKTAGELADLVGGEILQGDSSEPIYRVCPPEAAGRGDLCFVTKAAYLKHIKQPSAVLVSHRLVPELKLDNAVLIAVDDAYLAFAQVAAALLEPEPRPVGVHPSAVIESSAQVADSASIGPFCYVGTDAVIDDDVILHAGAHVHARARIGAGSILYDHVVVRHGCEVGAQCILHVGVVIGADGYGFAPEKTQAGVTHHKIPQTGIAVIEDHVEIGANSCVDRGTLGDTRIGAGTKIDNLVQVGHNVQIGRSSLLVAQSGVAGSSTLEEEVTLGAQAGISGHITIGAGAVVYGQSGVMENVAPNTHVMGSPATGKREHLRTVLKLRRMGRTSSSR